MTKFVKDYDIDWDRWMKNPPEIAKIKPASEWMHAVIDGIWGDNPDPGSVWPWGKTHNLFKHRPGELSIWAGYSGHKKSMILGNVILGFIRAGERACIASLEMPPQVTLDRMTKQAIGAQKPTGEVIAKFFAATDDRLWLYDQAGVVKHDKILALTRYCFDQLEGLNIDHMVIDSFMKCGIKKKDEDTAAEFINSLQQLAKDYGKHVHLVMHARKPQGMDSDSRMPTKYDIKGISELTDQTDNVIMIWSNKPKFEALQTKNYKNKTVEEWEEMPDMLIGIDKQRLGKYEGKVSLYLEKESLQHVAQYNMPPIDFLNHTAQYEAA